MFSQLLNLFSGKREKEDEVALKNTHQDPATQQVKSSPLELKNDSETGLILFPPHPDESSETSENTNTAKMH